MMRGLFRLTWLEIKIFFREPLGAIGTVFVPVLVFVLLGRVATGVVPRNTSPLAGFFKARERRRTVPSIAGGRERPGGPGPAPLPCAGDVDAAEDCCRRRVGKERSE